MLGKIAIVLAVLAAVSSNAGFATAEDPPIVIIDAIIKPTTPATIVIEGQQFRPGGVRDPNPQVFVGEPGGTLQPLDILNATNTSIVARMPAFTSGSYRLVVYRSDGRND